MLKKLVGSLLTLCLFATPWFGQAQSTQDEWSESVDRWIEQLAEKDDRFAAFENAERHWQPIEADNTFHLITVGERQDALGYFILGAEDENVRLMEYGLDAEILFSDRPFVPLPTSKVTSLYAGLESVWITEDGLRDAKSGEKYPLDVSKPTLGRTNAVDADHALTAASRLGLSDATTPWIQPGPEIKSEAALIQAIENDADLSYTAQLFEGKVLAPFAVKGYHRWEQAIMIELEDNGSRFIPVQHAFQLGAFYP